MKKKRMLTLIGLVVFAAYLISVFVAYTATYEIEAKEFSAFYNRISQMNGGGLFWDYEMPEAKTNALCGMLNVQSNMNSSYPYVAAVYDKDGNIIAKSGTYIEMSDGTGFEFCNLDDYMTSKIKKELLDFKERYRRIYVSSFAYNIENKSIVPVVLNIHDGNSNNKTITFSNDKASYLFDYNDEKGQIVEIELLDIDESHYNHRVYQNLFERLEEESVRTQAVKNIASDSYGGGGYMNSRFCEYGRSIVINDEKYYFYESTARNTVIENLASPTFYYFVSEALLFFVILSVVILIAASKIYDKNERLKKSQVAFIGAAAHELKTPVTVISNQCECILENVNPDKTNEYVRSIYDEALRMNKLLATLLQYTKLNSTDKIQKENVRISDLIDDEMKKYLPLIKDKDIFVEVWSDEELKAKCNADLISLVIGSLLSNAVKFTPHGGKIELKCKDERVSIFNEGSHISPDEAPHIWENFYKYDKARTRTDGSTGMGLAVSRRILELHGFQYGFSNKDNGVEFWFNTK